MPAPSVPVAPGEETPGEMPPGQEEIDLTPPIQRSTNYGLAQSDSSVAPLVIGDFLYRGAFLQTSGGLNSTLPIASGTARVKVCEKYGVIPVDRVFISYNHFHNALQTQVAGGPTNEENLDRVIFGGERTFWDDQLSIQAQLPITSRYADTDEFFGVSGGDWGNLAMSLKVLLYQVDSDFAVTAGLGVGLPTGSDGKGFDGNAQFRLRNESVFLQPWVGVFLRPTENTFIQTFAQVEFDATGSTFSVNGVQAGRFQEQSFFYLDTQFGVWLFRDRNDSFVEGLATLIEIHYASSLQNTDRLGGSVGGFGFNMSAPGNRADILNLTGGLNFDLGASYLTFAAVAPLKEDFEDKPFDTELVVQWNRFF